MHRTQIQLEDRQYEALKARARKEAKSLSELIRLAVDGLLGRTRAAKGQRTLDAIRGIAADPGGPAGRDHDALLYGDPE